MATIYGNIVTNTASGSTKRWQAKTVYTVTDYPTYVSITVTTYFSLLSDSAYFVKNRITSYWYMNDWLYKSATGPASTATLHQGDHCPATYTTTRQKTTTGETVTLYGKVVVGSSSDWAGTSTTAKINISIPALDDYTVTYNNNGGTGSQTDTKYYGVDLTLSDGTGFSKANSTLTGWNTASDGTGTAYELGGLYNANADTELYAQWHLDYLNPTVSNLNVYRVDATGSTSETDDGAYIYINFTYTGGSFDGGTNLETPSVKVTIDNTPVYNQAQSSTQGTFSDWYGTYSKDTAHTVVVTVYDANTDGVTYTEQITTATYPIDLRANGIDVYMGIMTPAVVGQTLKIWVDAIYPVGSYYETSDTAFNPNTYFGGTWLLEAEGQVHISAGTNYTVAGALTNSTDGGEATHTLTVDELPAHSHRQNYVNYNRGTGSNATMGYLTQTTQPNGALTEETGSGLAHNNMQPYIIVNRWHRTA